MRTEHSPGPASVPPADVAEWLATFEECVRECDYERARALFAEDVVAFGTRMPMAAGLDTLERAQWRRVWPLTRGFEFNRADLTYLGAGEGGVCVVAPWASLGIRPDGGTFPRRGRATLVLREGERGHRAVHSHFSLEPASDEIPGG